MASKQTAANGRIAIFDDEELLHDVQPSYFGTFTTKDWILTVCLFGMWLPVPYLRYRNTRYVLTTKRIINMQGSLTGSTTEETPYDNIAGDIRTSQGLIEGFLNKGTIEFEIEKERGSSATEREFSGKEGTQREMNIKREGIELTGIHEYQEISNSIRRLQAT